MGPMAKGPRDQWRTEDAYNSSADDNDGANRRPDPKLCQPKGTMAANCEKRRLQVRRRFWQLLGQVNEPALHTTMGMPQIKHNRAQSLCAAVRLCPTRSIATRWARLCRLDYFFRYLTSNRRDSSASRLVPAPTRRPKTNKPEIVISHSAAVIVTSVGRCGARVTFDLWIDVRDAQ